MSKKYYLVFDCEGTNDEKMGKDDNQIPYDLSGVVMERGGKIVEQFAFLCKEVFTDCELMNSAYYKRKMPEYLDRIRNGEIDPLTVQEIISRLADICRRWNITDLWAYNVRYDFFAIINLIERYQRKRHFPKEDACQLLDLNPCDIMQAAVETLCGPRKYYNFCCEHDFFSKKGNPNYGAEILYRFITNNADFQEEHKGLDDAVIESEILVRVFQTKRKVPKGVAPEYYYKRVNARTKHSPQRRQTIQDRARCER